MFAGVDSGAAPAGPVGAPPQLSRAANFLPPGCSAGEFPFELPELSLGVLPFEDPVWPLAPVSAPLPAPVGLEAVGVVVGTDGQALS